LETFKSFTTKLYSVNDTSFEDIALELFDVQARNNPLYNAFLGNLGVEVSRVRSLEEIPFLPISFFKTHCIQTGQWTPETTFISSGTTQNGSSKHAVADLQFYLAHAVRCFEHFFGSIKNYHFLALLPSYLERQGSSLIAMMEYFIRNSDSHHSGFYLNDYPSLIEKILAIKNDSRKTILWGVSFALLDLAEKFELDLSHCLVFETGGMKGRRREITKNEMREVLTAKINVKSLFSEYGMTEMLSQAYSKGEGNLICPTWMRVLCRDITDPQTKGLLSETGGINVIDLANWRTISFVETEDLGKVYPDGSFEVLGRLDNADVRGCNLMIQ
jgi:phenylacetate-coenzyme A ligase PaaK-like adenylate-forming protein